MTTMLDWAKAYSQRLDFAIFPLRPGEKKPACQNGFHDASKNLKQIERLFNSSNYNIGVATGSRSGILVIDFDIGKGDGTINGFETLEEWEDLTGRKLPSETWTSTTPSGGAHWYYKLDDDFSSVHRSGSAGVDIQANGAYIVLPPSFFNGKRYEWDLAPGDCDLHPVDENVLEFIEYVRNKEIKVNEVNECNYFSVPTVVKNGGRHNFMNSLIGSLIRRNLSDESIEAVIRIENKKIIEPPFTEQELQKEVLPGIKNIRRLERSRTEGSEEKRKLLMKKRDLLLQQKALMNR